MHGSHCAAGGRVLRVLADCRQTAGKSFILALVACYLAVFKDWRPYLTAGELGTIRIIATDRAQAKVIFRYAKALLTQVPSIEELIVRTTEILTALRPAMATIPGAMLLCASSPYSRRGILWRAFKEHWGREDSPILVWRAPTRTMNQTIPQSLVDAALAEDPAKTAAEFLAEFRVDIETFVNREVVEAAVITGRHELAPVSGVNYLAFVDPSGSVADSFTLAVAHREGDTVILDALRERRPKFSPESVVGEFTGVLMGYGVTEVTGDRYGGEWVVEQFRKHGITYQTSERPKNALYAEFLPSLNSGKVELLDHGRLIAELCALERRTGRGTGRDIVDHPPAGHDDLANATAGAVVMALQSAVGATVISPEALTRAGQATAYGRGPMRYGRSSPSPSVYGLPFSVSLTDLSGH